MAEEDKYEAKVVSRATGFGGVEHNYENPESKLHPEVLRRIAMAHQKLIEAGCAKRLETTVQVG